MLAKRHILKSKQRPTVLLAVLVVLALAAFLVAYTLHALLTAPGRSSTPVVRAKTASSPASPSPLDMGKLPLSFEPNVGNTNPSVRFRARVPGGAIFFTPNEVVLSMVPPAPWSSPTGQEISCARGKLPLSKTSNTSPPNTSNTPNPSRSGSPGISTTSTGQAVRMSFIGAASAPSITGKDRLPGIVN